jgi:DNA (cytosine-5)-methyltransferase 1
MHELALFAGAGGGILGGKLLGWRTVCAVEWDAHARDVLVARQNDGCLEPFPIWDDVQTFDGHPWRGCVDVVSGGFPCQDISAAGKGAGITGARSGMWSHMARIIGEVRPRFVFVENSPVLTSRGLGTVLGDLAAMGYDAQWGVLGAIDAGAPHKRERIWIMADADPQRRSGSGVSAGEREALLHTAGSSRGDETSAAGNGGEADEDMGDTDAGRRNGWAGTIRQADGRRQLEDASWWESEPDVGRVAHGVAARVDRLRCIGNGQVPAVAALAWRMLNSLTP